MSLRPLVSGVLASALVGAGLLAPASAAPGDSYNDLATELSTCSGTSGSPTVVVLTTDIVNPGGGLEVLCHARIDLNGNDLTILRIVIGAGESLDVTDTSGGTPGRLTADASLSGFPGIQNEHATFSTHGGAQVIAVGGTLSAGIGGDAGGDGGVTESHDLSSISAVGGTGAAGIGGGYSGWGGITASNDNSSITAIGGLNGAGIGGGDSGAGGTTASRDYATIHATGGAGASGGAGIGGGWGSPGGTTTIAGGTVTAIPGTSADPIGAGLGGPGSGPLRVTGGILRLPSGTQTVPAASTVASPLFEIGPDGIVAGGSPTSATIAGTGVLVNHGALVLPTANVTAPVSDHHYDVSFDLHGGSGTADPVSVFSSTFVTGDRTLPTPTRAGHTFLGWNTAADGSGDPITDDSELPGASADGTGVPITAHAQWTSLPNDLAGCTDGASFALTSDLSMPSRQLTVACDAQIDLAGHDLTVRNVVINSGESLDVTDTSTTGPAGHLTADASSAGATAGIQNTGATFTTHLRAGVTALGGTFGAGIGGGTGAGGTTTINDTSIVIATGGDQAAGIGGAFGRGGGVITVAGGTVTAIPGSDANPVGAGSGSSGGTVTVSGGVLQLPEGTQTIPAASTAASPLFAIGTGGRVTGGPSTSAVLAGTGVLANHGRLLLDTADVGAALVSDRHYRITFDLNGGSGVTPSAVTVYADTFDHGLRTFPATTPTRAGYTFLGWNTADDGSGDPISATAPLPGSSTTGAAVAITAYAAWSSDTAPVSPVTAPTITNTTSSERGTARPRVGDVLAVAGPLPGVTYSWLRGGSSTAAGTTYLLTSADVGSSLVLLATAAASSSYVGTATSAPTGVVEAGDLVAPQVAVTGKPQVGKALTAVPTGADDLEPTWQWETQAPDTDGWIPVPGATTDTFTPAAGQLRHLVRVTLTVPGHAAVSSSPSTPVTKGRLPKPARKLVIRGQDGTLRIAGLKAYRQTLPEDATVTVRWFADRTPVRARITVKAPGYRTLRLQAFRPKG